MKYADTYFLFSIIQSSIMLVISVSVVLIMYGGRIKRVFRKPKLIPRPEGPMTGFGPVTGLGEYESPPAHSVLPPADMWVIGNVCIKENGYHVGTALVKVRYTESGPMIYFMKPHGGIDELSPDHVLVNWSEILDARELYAMA